MDILTKQHESKTYVLFAFLTIAEVRDDTTDSFQNVGAAMTI